MMISWVRKNTAVPGRRLVSHEEKNGLVWLSAPLMDGLRGEGFIHGFSTRLGGVSSGDVGTMNMSFAREENPENVRENYRRIGEAIGFDPVDVVMTYQTHTKNIRVVTQQDRGKGFSRERDYTDIDGLVTNVPGIVLASFSADCVPLLIADPAKRAVAAVHSGWRGTVADIGGEAVRTMQRRYGCDPEDLVAVIGPSICQDCYEVSEDVITRFEEVYPEPLWNRLFYRKDNGKYQLDLWEGCRQNFLHAGLKGENISVTDICTHCNPDLLFSHRTLHGRQGNLAAFITIRAPEQEDRSCR